jgi:hypothetical protein
VQFSPTSEPVTPILSVTAPPENSVQLFCGETEMLRVAKDGFYVRGKKLKQDDKETEEVYNCFKEWLAWSTLNRT